MSITSLSPQPLSTDANRRAQTAKRTFDVEDDIAHNAYFVFSNFLLNRNMNEKNYAIL